MKKLYFIVMRIFNKKRLSRIYQWVYMRCMRAYMAKDPDLGYWRFAKDYFANSK